MPNVCNLVVSILFGLLSDKLISSGKVKRLTARKIFNGIGNYGPALGMIWMAFVGCDRVMAIVVLCIATTLDGASYAGYMVSRSQSTYPGFKL